MHNEDAGIPTLTPKMIFEAITRRQTEQTSVEDKNSQISHQTGEGLLTFPVQTMQFTNSMRQATAVHSIKAQVPEFHAWMCHGRGIQQRMKPRNEKIGKSG